MMKEKMSILMKMNSSLKAKERMITRMIGRMMKVRKPEKMKSLMKRKVVRTNKQKKVNKRKKKIKCLKSWMRMETHTR